MIKKRKHCTRLASKVCGRRHTDCLNGGSTPNSGGLATVAPVSVETCQSPKTSLNIQVIALSSHPALIMFSTPKTVNHFFYFLQFFVNVSGRQVSLQRTPETMLGSAIFEAMCRSKCKLDDFYVVYGQHILELDQSLVSQNIIDNSTVEVRSRMRGGAGQL
jgi:hypothetical protein